ncbi:MAG: mitochondrial fission ELM1 family protein [Alphaproteobacteria bacterium]|nr:mitochondrial fission ELM1 family protein [Alphaproteobacteria bacterium]
MQSWVISEAYAGLQAQALGLAEAAGLAPELRVLCPRLPWRFVPARFWPAPLAAVAPEALAPPLPQLVIGAGGVAAAVAAALRPRGPRVVQVQHPRMDIRRFDLILAARHDGLAGPNVIVTRTALHRVTPTRLHAAAACWAPRLAHLPRPLVAVLVGGSNGRWRLDRRAGAALAAALAGMMDADRVGLALTPSRRTHPAVAGLLAQALVPRGGWVWDGAGENPYFGLLALADAIVVTADSMSMISEAVATRAPVMLARLPGWSRRQAAFIAALEREGRVRPFAGRLERWPVEPIDDTPQAAAEMRRRLGF